MSDSAPGEFFPVNLVTSVVPTVPDPPPPHAALADRVAALEDAFTEWQRRYNSFVGDVSRELGL